MPFRLPDFRWFSNFPLFRDSQQKPSDIVYPQYPGSAQIPDQRHRSQSQSGQYPVYFNSSGYVDPGPWHGYAPYPSQINRRAHPSQPQGQYQPQQPQQVQNRHLPQTRPPPQPIPQSQPRIAPQPQMSQAAQPYFYPNVDSNPSPYHRHRRHPQERPQDSHKPPEFPDVNNRFNNSQQYLTPRAVQTSAHQAWTPLPNTPRAPPHHSTPNPQNPHSRATKGKSRAAPEPARSTAPQLRSRMLKIPLIHPLVCRHRHSLIPDQIPETEVGRTGGAVWDGQSFILPRGSQAPMMIDAVQVRSLRLDWDITLPPSFSKEIGRDGQVFTPPRHLYLPLINAKFKSEVCIKTRQDNPLTNCFLRWGCIVVEPRDPNGISPTMKQFLYDIWEYFHTSLTEEECRSLTERDLAKLRRIVQSRRENYAGQGEQSTIIGERGPMRRDLLSGYTRFAGLEVCPRFADTGDLFLYLEPV